MKFLFTIAVSLLLCATFQSAQSQSWLWSNWIPTNASDDNFNALATDNAGHVYVAFQFSGTLNIGTYTFNSNPVEDVCVAKYDSSGNVLWAVAFGSLYWDQVNGMDCDNAGNLYLAGHYFAKLWYGSDSLVGNAGRDMFLMRINSNGTFGWAVNGANPWDEEGTDVKVNSDNEVVMSGRANNTSHIGNLQLLQSGLVMQEFIAKFDNAGNGIWIRSCGGTNSASLWYSHAKLEIGLNDEIHITFHRDGDLVFAGDSFPDPGNTNVVILKWSNLGDPLWGWLGMSGGSELNYDLAVDNNGNVYTAISSPMYSVFAGDTLDVPGNWWGLTFIQLDSNGNESNHWHFETENLCLNYAVETDLNNNVWFGGLLRDSLFGTFGKLVATPTFYHDAYVFRLNALTGSFDYYTRITGAGLQYVDAIDVAGDGRIYVGGNAGGSTGAPTYYGIQHDITHTFTFTGATYPFIARLGDPDCNLTNDVLVISDSTACLGELVLVEAPDGFVSQLWSNGSVNDTLHVPAGSYFFSGIDETGCVVKDTVNIAAAEPVTFSIDVMPPLCSNDANGVATVDVLTGASPFAFAWSNGASLDTVQNLAAGNYVVTVTSADGCWDAQSVVVPEPGELTLAMSFDLSTGDYIVWVETSGGTPPYAYTWNPPAGDNDTLYAITAGNYSVTATDTNGCTASSSILVTSSSYIEDNLGVFAFPNPAEDFLTLHFSQSGAYEILITDVTGRRIDYSVSNINDRQIEIRNLAPGWYAITVSNNATVTKQLRVVVQ